MEPVRTRARLKLLDQIISFMINDTPTGHHRNFLTEIRFFILECIEESNKPKPSIRNVIEKMLKS